VVRVGSVAHAEKETDDKDSEAAGHKSFEARRVYPTAEG
jgi:hypothetical protein